MFRIYIPSIKGPYVYLHKDIEIRELSLGQQNPDLKSIISIIEFCEIVILNIHKKYLLAFPKAYWQKVW